MKNNKATVLPVLLLILTASVLLVVGCGSNNQSSNKSTGEDKPLSPEEGRRGSDSILFGRNDNPDWDTSDYRYFIIEEPGDKPIKIGTEQMLFPNKAPDGNSLACFSRESDFRALNLYDIDTGSDRVFQVADAIEKVRGIPVLGLHDFSWAPDGRSIYVCVAQAPSALGAHTPVSITFRYYLDDGSCTEIETERPGAEASLSRVMDKAASVEGIAVSPSGTRIIVNTFWCGDLYEHSVRNIKKIIPEPIEDNGLDCSYSQPIWLNEHEVIYMKGPENNLTKLDVDTGTTTIVLKGTPEMRIAWVPVSGIDSIACSPEGDRILFSAIGSPKEYVDPGVLASPLYVINADGSGLVQATDPEKDGAFWGDLFPCWASR